ncbi:RNA-binding cell elongation regulator Jag/EloR [Ruminococcus sp. HUN007]|uniref:RNA-binding cell elongation regulator Jag/EloR n=1 Tax=Ruminococcus sp. HUN007 TaxID=1514668 RepID=UPI0005D2A537|nr:RNA-binding cell elongation regulator Jag/EloR [Ruminococcus sp. HUN007]
MKNVFIGKTVEEAKMKAAEEFGVSVSEISFTVLEEPKKGLFGLIKGDARVEAVYDPAEPAAAGAVPVAEVTVSETAVPAESPAETEAPKPAKKFDGSKAEAAVEYILNIFDKMGVKAEYTYEETEDGVIINLSSDDTSFIIGRRGENLDAIQYLASMFCNRIDDEYYRVVLDSNGYREKRKKTLEDLAKKIAKNVLRSGRSTVLEPMNPYERRIIHSMISEIEGVSSRSVGEEPYRKIIISSLVKKERRHGDKRGGKGGGRRGGDRKNRNFEPKSLDLKTSFEKDYKKPKPEDDLKAGLYGKIEI